MSHAVLEVIESIAAAQLSESSNKDTSDREKVPRLEERDEDTPYMPYLCSRYDCYAIKEPCLMCGMALLHSRIQRMIFAIPDKDDGAYTVHKLHGKQGLNHHYSVFKLEPLRSPICDSTNP